MSDVATLPGVERPGGAGLRARVKPPERLRSRWREDGRDLSERGYPQRWVRFWGKVVRACAVYGPVAEVDVALVEEYVERTRLAELHLRRARDAPYATMTSGFVQAHPGFAQSRAEAKMAREAADALGLTPYRRRRAGILAPPSGPDPDAGDGDEERGWTDDQVGPEGERL